MEMEMEAGVETIMERLSAAAGALEQAAERLAAVELQASATRESELADRLAAAETTIATLRAQAGRKTSGAGTLQAKEGVAGLGHELQSGALDAALGSLSLEQRIAVKAQLMRGGLLG